MSILCGYNFRVCLRTSFQFFNTVECRRLASRKSMSHFAFSKRDEIRMERFMKRTSDLVAGNKKKKKDLNSVNNIQKTLALDPTEQLKIRLSNKIVMKMPRCTSPRMKQLSSVFANHVAALLQTGEICSELTELGFEVNDVVIAPGLAYVVISWRLANEDNLPQVMELLPKTSSSIRNALTDTRVIAHVPPVMFYRDSTHSKLEEVQHLLSIADMGTKENEEFRNEDREGSSEDCHKDDDPESANVYGIDYGKFKDELMVSKKKTLNKILVESALDKKLVEIYVEKV